MPTRALLLFLPLLLSAQNSLTPEEARAGWRLLFDGRTFTNWQDPAKKTPPGDSWTIEDGALRTLPNPRIAEDLFTTESYRDFELQFDWKVSPGANSGLKYRIQKQLFVDHSRIQHGPGGWEGIAARELANPLSVRAQLAPTTKGGEFALGFEFQLIDDDRHPDAKAGPTRQTGALYAMLPPSARAARPAGEWNHSRLVAQANHIEHWINGVKVLDGSLTDPALKQNTLARWGNFPIVANLFLNPSPTGPLCLQHHGDLVWFRNLKIRPR